MTSALLVTAPHPYHGGHSSPAVAKTFEARAEAVEDLTLRADTYRLLAETEKETAQKHRLVDLAVRSALAGRAHVMLAAALIDQGRIREWEGDLEDAAVRFELAEAAVQAVDALAVDFPGLEESAKLLHGQLRLAMGNLARRQGDLHAHLEHQRAALKHFSSSEHRPPLREATAWANVGEAHRLLGQFSEAEEAYSKAIALARPLLPKDNAMLQAIYSNRGAARQDLGNWKGAREDYARVEAASGHHGG
jgi:tetratricopeptide (TPR) repeat protein